MSAVNENCESTCWDSAVLPELDTWMATAAAGPGSCLVPSGVGEEQKDSDLSTVIFFNFIKELCLCAHNLFVIIPRFVESETFKFSGYGFSFAA